MKIQEVQQKIKLPRLPRLNWGVAGLGNFAENSVIPTLLQLKRSNLVSVFSKDEERSEKIGKKFSAKSFAGNYEEFLNSGIEVVYISSANPDHYWQTIQALKAGKHVLCEKPMAMNSKEAEEMVRTAKENNVFLSVNYLHRFHPLLRKAKELLDKKFVGKVISISTDFNIDYPPDGNYRFHKEQGGGPLRDLGTHMFDVMRFLNGEITEVKGFKDNVIYQSEVEDFATGVVKFENGTYGNFAVSFNSSKSPNQIIVQGSKGYITIQNLIGKKFVPAKLTIDIEGETRKTFRRRANNLLIRMKEFQKSVLKNTTPEVTGEDGLQNLILIEKFEAQC